MITNIEISCFKTTAQSLEKMMEAIRHPFVLLISSKTSLFRCFFCILL